MHSAVFDKIEQMIPRLSDKEQLWLIEELAHCLREPKMTDVKQKVKFQDQLVAMASDPQIQDELQKINQEFKSAETDGLEFE